MPDRFFEGYPWRFLFADIPCENNGFIGGATTTWADGLLTNREITFTLNQPSTINCDVWPDDRRVNALWDDGFPLVSQNNRIIYAFRREAPGPIGTEPQPPWVCRAAGLLMSPEDQGDTEIPLSHLVAYDAWQYLNGRPCVDATGQLPDSYGQRFLAQRGSDVVRTLLKNTILNNGFAYIDAGEDWGGTPFYNGTVEDTDVLNIIFQQGTMIGDAWTQLCETGTLDIVLNPIYDWENRPGYTHELNIKKLAGNDMPSAVFGWDMMNRGAANIDRMHDGTPGNFADKVLYYVGQGGPAAVIQTNTEAIAAFGEQWATQFFPENTIPSAGVITQLAMQAISLSKQGQRTMTLNVTPQRSPIPLIQYNLGDRVPIYASNRLRTTSAGYQRVQAIPISITDDGIERVSALLCSPDWRTEI